MRDKFKRPHLMFHRLPPSPAGLFWSHSSPPLSSLSPRSFSNSDSALRSWFPSWRKASFGTPRSPLGPALLSGALLGPRSSSQRPAPTPSTRRHRGTPPAEHPDFAPSTLPLPPAPPASATPAPHPSTAPQHAPRPRPPYRTWCRRHGLQGKRRAAGEFGRAHEPFGRSAGLGARGAPTRLPHGCNDWGNESSLVLPGLPATAAGPRPPAHTAPPPPPPAGPIGLRPRRSSAGPASPHRPAPHRPGAHAGAGLLAAETWHRLVAASAWGSWSRPTPGRAAGGTALREGKNSAAGRERWRD